MDAGYFSWSNMQFEFSVGEDVFAEYLIPCDDDDDDEFEGYVLPDDDDRVEQEFDSYSVFPSDDEVEFEEELDEFDFEEPAAAAAAAAADRLKTVVIEPMERCKTCSICLEELEVGGEATAIECAHKFHTECLLRWLAIKMTCPCCRFHLL